MSKMTKIPRITITDKPIMYINEVFVNSGEDTVIIDLAMASQETVHIDFRYAMSIGQAKEFHKLLGKIIKKGG